jgi:hypothetical protein
VRQKGGFSFEVPFMGVTNICHGNLGSPRHKQAGQGKPLPAMQPLSARHVPHHLVMTGKFPRSLGDAQETEASAAVPSQGQNFSCNRQRGWI